MNPGDGVNGPFLKYKKIQWSLDYVPGVPVNVTDFDKFLFLVTLTGLNEKKERVFCYIM